MQSPEICPSCNNELNHAGAFCKHCGIQARCKSCQGLLEVDSCFCASCGLAVGSESSEELIKSPLLGGAVNRIKYDETKSTRSMEAHLTNEAVSDLSSTFLNYIVNGSSSGTQNKKTASVRPPTQHPELPGTEVQDADEVTIEAEVVANNGQSFQSTLLSADAEKLKQIFLYDDDKLKLDDSRLKATGQLDFAKRLTYLFLYAHKLEGRKSVSRSSINEVLKNAGVYEPNSIHWISTGAELGHENDSGRLRPVGREAAQKTLQEITNPTMGDKWMPGVQSSSRSKEKSKATNSEDKVSAKSTSSTTSVPKDVKEWAVKWHNSYPQVDGFEVLKGRTLTDKGVFALWSISEVTNDAQIIVSRDKLAKFLHEAWGVKAAQGGSFDTALTAKNTNDLSAGKIKKVPGGYQLLPPGINYAQQMIGGASSNSAAKGKPPKK